MRLVRGRELFNAGCYFEAHEVWEDAWLKETGVTRRMLQGLIQVAAGFYKAARRDSPSGCARLLEAGLSKLEGIPDGTGRLALDRFRSALTCCLEEAWRWRRGESGPLPARVFPKLRSLAQRKRARRSRDRTPRTRRRRPS